MLLQACAHDALTPEQQEWLLGEAERHNLPLMLDEESGKLVWPGTPEYEDWAKGAPDEEDADWGAMQDAFMEVFADEINAAEAAAEQLTQQVSDAEQATVVRRWLLSVAALTCFRHACRGQGHACGLFRMCFVECSYTVAVQALSGFPAVLMRVPKHCHWCQELAW